MGLIREAKGHTEGVIVALQESVSVLALVQSGHGALKLLQPCTQVLLGPPPAGQVGLHHLAQREVVACICTLRQAMRIQTKINFITWVLSDHKHILQHDMLSDISGDLGVTSQCSNVLKVC